MKDIMVTKRNGSMGKKQRKIMVVDDEVQTPIKRKLALQ